MNNFKEIRWNQLKDKRLKKSRGVSFKELVNSRLITIKEHPKRQEQGMMLIQYKQYVWVIPFVEEGDYIFLKTLYPSRKYTRLYRAAP